MTATRTRELTDHAAAAKMIRGKLKQAFPSVRFTVRSESYSGGSAVRVNWTDGPTTREVEALTGEHQYGHFDGMIDLYEYSNVRKDIPQVRFVQEQRDHSREAREAMVELLNRRYGWDLALGEHGAVLNDASTGSGWRSQEIYRELHKRSLLCPCGAAILPGDRFCPECGQALSHEEE